MTDIVRNVDAPYRLRILEAIRLGEDPLRAPQWQSHAWVLSALDQLTDEGFLCGDKITPTGEVERLRVLRFWITRRMTV